MPKSFQRVFFRFQCTLPNFLAYFCAPCLHSRSFCRNSSFLCTSKNRLPDGPAGGFCGCEWVSGWMKRGKCQLCSLFHCLLFGCIDEQRQHSDRKEDAHRVSNCGVIDGGTLGSLTVQRFINPSRCAACVWCLTATTSSRSASCMGHIDFWTDCLIPFWQSVIT